MTTHGMGWHLMARPDIAKHLTAWRDVALHGKARGVEARPGNARYHMALQGKARLFTRQHMARRSRARHGVILPNGQVMCMSWPDMCMTCS